MVVGAAQRVCSNWLAKYGINSMTRKRWLGNLLLLPCVNQSSLGSALVTSNDSPRGQCPFNLRKYVSDGNIRHRARLTIEIIIMRMIQAEV